jgi:hypothetical protein
MQPKKINHYQVFAMEAHVTSGVHCFITLTFPTLHNDAVETETGTLESLGVCGTALDTADVRADEDGRVGVGARNVDPISAMCLLP